MTHAKVKMNIKLNLILSNIYSETCSWAAQQSYDADFYISLQDMEKALILNRKHIFKETMRTDCHNFD